MFSRQSGDKENSANGMNGEEFDERSKIDYGSRMFDDATASLHGDKYRNTVNFQKNASSADLNLTLQGYEYDRGSTRKLVKLSNNPQSSPEGLPLPSRNGGTNFDTFEFLKPLEHPRHSGRS